MTSSDIRQVPFSKDPIIAWGETDSRHSDWPVVYTLDGPKHVYIGETTQAATRLRQHLARKGTRNFKSARVIVDDTFNKSACLDLEAYLIRMFAGDGQYTVDNANAGLSESNYYDRDGYRERFEGIFEQLRAEGLFSRSSLEITNSDLFKLSPFKALAPDQNEAVLAIVESLLSDVRADENRLAVVQGNPGTGKTVVAIFLMKLLVDIRDGVQPNETDGDSVFAGFFTESNTELLRDFKAGLVIPQQSLRKTVKKVFRNTPGLSPAMVLSPYDVVQASETFDLLIVDEAHRLQQLSATLPTLITKFKQINTDLYGDEQGGDQLDWIRSSSRHSLLMLDTHQTVRPADIPSDKLRAAQIEAEQSERLFPLRSQMRVQAGEDYTTFIRDLLEGRTPAPIDFAEYEFGLFDDLSEMRRAIHDREQRGGLSRLVAGYAWEWKSKKDRTLFDIEIGHERLQWNRTATDWINSPTSAEEVGSIHTVQGYDLNYAGVIIGPDLRYSEDRGLHIDRASYFDAKGKANNKMLGISYSDEDLQAYISNIYVVLLTRGIRGTFVYACDPGLREYLRRFIPTYRPGPGDLLLDPQRSETDWAGPSHGAPTDRQATGVHTEGEDRLAGKDH